ncbi:MAG TPA: amidohydrolase family protein [Xanthobacteraceae bacterium]|nr:amidohydrolase family protein [Xanthobacteraceae bacterium]
MVAKIALEEHFLDPATEPYWRSTMVDVAPQKTSQLYACLTDFGERRLKMMEEHGIARMVLSVAGPGVQAERDTATAIQRARASNDFLAREVQKRPDRYSGLAHLPMQDPKAAADELERCMRELKFCGAMINGHTNGKYLDDRAYDPFWERAAALGAAIYLHPADPVAPLPVLAGYTVLVRPMWGWGVETGSHALRIICGGVFHRYPQARLVLGHLGEMLPFLLWRFDSRSKPYGWNLPKPPSQYIKENVWVTLSGMYDAPPMHCSLDALGRDRVMFSADYPFDSDGAGAFMDKVPLDENLRADIAYNNAAKLLGLK